MASFYSFLLQPLTVIMSQARQAVLAIKLSILLLYLCIMLNGVYAEHRNKVHYAVLRFAECRSIHCRGAFFSVVLIPQIPYLRKERQSKRPTV
jgi:hypothetical protein